MNYKAHYIGGRWIEGQGESITKFSPIDQQVLWQANSADASQVRAACHAAREAFYAWSHLPASERSKVIQAFAVLL
ncbi:aldehyde dehydrogenase family protein, partial [Enterobacter hormaechei]|nr:aldehyde dehydrogenase family protein [Enterobacter hormaechei]